MHTTDPLTVGEVARRSGFAESAIRYYERLGLLSATRTAGGQRRFERSMLRRLAFIRAARNIGLSLAEVAEALASLPAGRTPTRADWSSPSDSARAGGPGAVYLPSGLRREIPHPATSLRAGGERPGT